MKKAMKSCLCLLVTVAMLMSILCLTTSAESSLEPNSRYNGYLNAGEYFLCSFTPTVSGYYLIESIGNQDAVVVLYDASYTVLENDDDSGTGDNFRLCSALSAGQTYYYQIALYDEYASGTLEFDFYGLDVITPNFSYTTTLISDASSWGVITPTATSLVTFEADGGVDSMISLYDGNMNVIAEDDDSGCDGAFKISAILQAGRTYFTEIRFYDSNVAGDIVYNVYDASYTIYPDQGETVSVDAGRAGWASFTPDRTTYYTIASYDSGDTKVALYDDSGKRIAENDDANEYTTDFLMSYCLTAGRTYYFEIRFYNASDYGDIYFEFYEEYYPDVSATAWYYDAVSYVTYYGFMSGYQNGKFGPADNLQRQDFVVALARINGADLTPYLDQTGGLSDVTAGSYYAPAVAWAVDNGIITGYQNGEFGVGDTITREQVCTIFYRYVGSPEVTDAASTLSAFPDCGRISAFAEMPMAWAIQNGVISGMQSGEVAPTAGASRAQIATIIMRMDVNGMF